MYNVQTFDVIDENFLDWKLNKAWEARRTLCSKSWSANNTCT
jgi:hypothetical protein